MANTKTKKKYVDPGTRRIMDLAWLRDRKSGIIYTGEQLSLALLLHTKGKTNRSRQEQEEVIRILEDM